MRCECLVLYQVTEVVTKSKHAMGALAKLTRLNLNSNKIGDVGLATLAEACAKGALAKLKPSSLSLGRNPASLEAQQAVKHALASRA